MLIFEGDCQLLLLTCFEYTLFFAGICSDIKYELHFARFFLICSHYKIVKTDVFYFFETFKYNFRQND